MLITDTAKTLLTLLIALLLFWFFVLRKQWQVKREMEKEKGTVWKGISNEDRIRKAIERLDEAFQTPFLPFVFPEDVKQILERDPESEYGLNLLLQRIAAHCGSDRVQISLRVLAPEKGKPPGWIMKLGSQYLMELHIDCREFKDSIPALIVHEFCHFFLDLNGLKLEQTLENEILTDVAAVYFGFGKVMREGYRPTFHLVNGQNEWHRIGYLDVEGIDLVRKILEERNEK